MAEKTRDQSLAVLRWLIEAGADEAVSETPVNRFAQPPNASLPSASRAPSTARNEGPRERGTPMAADKSRAAVSASTAAQAVSLSTAPGAARALAQSCTTLAELKTAL